MDLPKMKCCLCAQKLIVFICKCKKIVCIQHRNKHSCTFKEELFKVEGIVKDKISKI